MDSVTYWHMRYVCTHISCILAQYTQRLNDIYLSCMINRPMKQLRQFTWSTMRIHACCVCKNIYICYCVWYWYNACFFFFCFAAWRDLEGNCREPGVHWTCHCKFPPYSWVQFENTTTKMHQAIVSTYCRFKVKAEFKRQWYGGFSNSVAASAGEEIWSTRSKFFLFAVCGML